MMTYEQAEEWIGQCAVRGSVLGLENIRCLMHALGDVQEELPIIHIAGTNGKGSVGAYLASILRGAGYHIGRYATPAVFDPLELWQYDGENISRQEYAGVMSQVKEACDMLASGQGVFPTVFEIETAAAFVYFSRKKPDYLLLEVMMGGSTDATNVITKPKASVITSISMDHMQFLGNTPEEIAAVKAGIIKEGAPVFSAPQTPEAERVLSKRAWELSVPILFVQEEALSLLEEAPGRLRFSYAPFSYTLGHPMELESSLAGHYQMKNAALATEVAAWAMLGRPPRGDADGAGRASRMQWEDILLRIRDGIQTAVWPGRFEVIRPEPLFLIDGAHNAEAAEELAKTVQNCLTNQKITYIIGVLGDKDYVSILKAMLPYAARVFTVTPEHARALPGQALAEAAAQIAAEAAGKQSPGNEASEALEIRFCETLEEAAEEAGSYPEPVLAFGSLSYLGALKELVRRDG